MLTLTVPGNDLLDRLSDLPVGVRLVRWDLRSDLAGVAADEVDVVIPHYLVGREGFRRLRGLPHLKVVQLTTAGYENAVPYLPAGVTLCNARGVHDAGTAELALALTLASQRGIDGAVRRMASGQWLLERKRSLADRRVVLVGYGSVGKAIARRLDPFEVEVVAVARSARTEDRPVHGWEELPALLPTADVVILIVPLTPQTTGLVDADFLAAMADDALLVNVARGKVVDTAALLVELESGRLRAALDVTDPEPLPPDHPLWHAPNVIITPHVGGTTDATGPRFAALVRQQVGALLAGGELANVVACG